MYQSYEINFYIFYQAFESFEKNFKYLSGKKWKNVWMASIKKEKEKYWSLVYKGFNFGGLLATWTFMVILVERK